MSRTLGLFACAAAMLAFAVGVAVVLKDEPGYEAGRLEISGKIEGLTEYQEGRSEDSGKADQQSAASSAEKTEARSSAASKEREEPAPAEASEKKESSEKDAPSPAAASSASETLSVHKAQSVQSVSSGENALELPASAEVFPGAASAETEDKTVKSTESAPAESSATPSLKKEVLDVVEKKAPEKKETAVTEKAQAHASEKPAAEKASASRPAVSPVKEALAEARSAVEDAPEAAVEKSPAASSEKPAQRYERVVTSAKFSMKGSLIKLVLQGNAPMVGHYSVLGNPDRVVLDLAGNWEITVPRVPSNRLIQAVRVGQHDDKTRIVFDMKTMGRVALVPLNRNSLELSIQ